MTSNGLRPSAEPKPGAAGGSPCSERSPTVMFKLRVGMDDEEEMRRLSFLPGLAIVVTLSISGSAAMYQVAPGDTLTAIASGFNTSVVALRTTNGLRDPSRIYAGQHLTVPGEAHSTPPPGGL